MVNMYSMGSIGMNNSSGGNVYQQMKAKYSCGYEDVGTRPYARPYPMGIVPRAKQPKISENWIIRLFQRYFI